MRFGNFMSKIAKIPVKIKEGVSVSLSGKVFNVTGVKGNLSFVIPQGISVEILDGQINIKKTDDSDKTDALSGLTRAVIANMVTGVSAGFEKKLELSGVGYRAQAAGDTLTLSVGFSHPVVVKDSGVSFAVEEGVITISGIDKTLIGNVAAKIRAIRPPEPYKGKGIKYLGEKIRRKAGKAVKTLGAKPA